jgi:hypothetical protein
MTKTWMAGLLSAMIFSAAAAAKGPADGRTPVLLELFTSEGCSSCPPADRLLEALDEKQPFPYADLIVLSEHVDYWNSGGWRDPFSSKAFSVRQSRYAQQFHLDDIYTPQLVVDGRLELVGSNGPQAKRAIEAAAEDKKIALTLSNLTRSGDAIHLHVQFAELPGEFGPATLVVALAEDKARSDVRNGENAGRFLTHVAVVRAMTPVASVRSGEAFSKDLNLPLSGLNHLTKLRVVVFLQTNNSRQIAGAAQGKL